MAVRFCLAMEMRMSRRALKAVTISFSLLLVLGAVRTRRALASGQAATQPLVNGISIHDAAGGAVVIDISLTQSVPYHTMQLRGPDRLVVDLKGAIESDLRAEYPAHSQLLERVRTNQWKSDPAVFRVVADLKGNPSFSVKAHESGIRIELRPLAAKVREQHGSEVAEAKPSGHALEAGRQTAQEDPPPNTVFQVHRFKDLSASLTAPVLPPHDRLVPVAAPDLTAPRRKGLATPALVSGISIQPGGNGETTINIASSRSVPYRVFQLSNPFRLVIDLKDARNASSQEVYQVNSPVLKKVRVGQWSPDNPSVVRVVADLEGYPIFDVYAQRPGIRIELKPRHDPAAVMRNPFKFETDTQGTPTKRPGSPSVQVVTAGANPPGAAPETTFSNLALIGFIEKKDAGTQAVISHQSNVYLVSKGDTFENTFTVLAISANAVEVQNTKTLETRWIPYTP
jgi:AMIN domain